MNQVPITSPLIRKGPLAPLALGKSDLKKLDK